MAVSHCRYVGRPYSSRPSNHGTERVPRRRLGRCLTHQFAVLYFNVSTRGILAHTGSHVQPIPRSINRG